MTGRRGYALLAVGVAAFTVYGSLVPFHYRPRPWADAVEAFARAMRHVSIESRSDLIANVLLGVPLGFGLLGALRADRPGRPATLLAGLAIWPGCVAFAAAVEFLQLYFPDRTCSGSDVLAQAAGSAAGMLGWVLAGPRATEAARRAWEHPRSGGTTGRFLVAYLALIALVQLLPLDLTISPYRVYHKVRDRQGTLKPFSELYREDGQPAPDRWGKVQTWVELFGLYFPAGLLTARLPGRVWRSWRGLPAVAVAGLALGLAMEAGQLFVSRHPSSTDALVGGAGALAGWAVSLGARRLLPPSPLAGEGPGVRGKEAHLVGNLPGYPRGLDPSPPAPLPQGERGERQQAAAAPPGGLSLEGALLLGQAWFALLAVASWLPFDFGRWRPGAVTWVPLADYETKNYLGSLDVLLTRAVLFLPVGVLAAAVGAPPGRWRAAGAAAVGLAAGGVLELGQLFLPDRYPSTTDVLLSAAGAWLGAAVARRLRGVEAG